MCILSIFITNKAFNLFHLDLCNFSNAIALCLRPSWGTASMPAQMRPWCYAITETEIKLHCTKFKNMVQVQFVQTKYETFDWLRSAKVKKNSLTLNSSKDLGPLLILSFSMTSIAENHKQQHPSNDELEPRAFFAVAECLKARNSANTCLRQSLQQRHTGNNTSKWNVVVGIGRTARPSSNGARRAELTKG